MLRHSHVNVTAVIVSPMRAVYSQSLRNLRAILHCDSRETQKLGRRMSDAGITSSLKIWQQYAQSIGIGSTGEREEEALIDQGRIEMLEMEENEPNEDVERVERIEGVSDEEQQRNGRRRDDESEGREEIQGDEEREQGEAGTHEQSAKVGEVAEPATDEDQDESGEAPS
jgi:hypothetical protein